MPIDYSKSKIYKLTTIHNPELVYFGSTVNSLSKRKNKHKSEFNTNKQKTSSIKLFELGANDVIITLVENVNCNNKEELFKRERFYIENNMCVNKVIPNRTHKERYDAIYKDKMKIQKKEYYESNIDRIKEYREENKDKKKEYYEVNKNKILQLRKEYYEANKDIIKKRQKQYRILKIKV
jgi:hypothetical protein